MLRIALIGAGLIGRQHAARMTPETGVSLAAVVDPAPEGRALAEERGAAWHPDLGGLLAGRLPDGAVVATPNRLHVAQALALVRAGVPVLVEKPIAEDVAAAEGLVATAEAAGVALLVGHHRRHSAVAAAAKAAVDGGMLGRVVAVQATCWLAKPPGYFDAAWRREPGAGPVLINLIHDIDMLRHLCGEIVGVQAMASRAVRGFAVEDTAAVLLRFEGGALGTMSVSDTVAAPWSWEFTSGENAAYSRTGESCYLIGGSEASLAVPQLDVWRHEGRPDWWRPIGAERIAVAAADPLVWQMRHFGAVIRGEAVPLVSGRDGLAALRVVAAIQGAVG